MRMSYLIALLVLAVVAYAIYTWGGTPVPPPGDDRMEVVPTMNATSTLTLSSVFQNGEAVPSQFTCDGENTSPPLSWSGVPLGTQSFALIMDDPDIPQVFKDQRGIDSFDHWTLFNIPATTTSIAASNTAGVVGANSSGEKEYTGPCPPPQYQPSEHRYFFRLYALDTMLSLREGASKAEVLSAIQGHILGQAELMGRYKRQ